MKVNEEWYWRLLERVGGNKKSGKKDRKGRGSRVGRKRNTALPMTWRGTMSINAAKTMRA